MSVKLYYVSSSASSRKARKYLVDNNIEFTEQSMILDPLSWEQLFEILRNTENGVEDILSLRSKDYEVLTKQGMNFEELTLTELHKVIEEHPRLLRAPIMTKKNVTLVGYNDEEIETLNNRKDKKKAYYEVLNRIRAEENRKLAELIESGHDDVVAV